MVRNITLSADEALIAKAREKAARERRSLNSAFREWLASYAGTSTAAEEYKRLMQRLRYVTPGRKSTPDEINER